MFWKDVEKIHKNLKVSSKSYKRLRKEFFNKITLIKENPYIYQKNSEDGKDRRMILYQYIIFYRIEYQNIFILRIVSQKMNYNLEVIYKRKSIKKLEFNNRK